MSINGALNTAISGLTAQSAAFSNISDDVANSQTVGFKRVDTSFLDYLTTSTRTDNESGSVSARPDYVNTIQGAITQTSNPLGLAISGQGFFVASAPVGTNGTLPVFSATPQYTRAGDFTLDQNGYLVNSVGLYLNGWSVDPASGITDRSTLQPIKVGESTDPPRATGSVTLAANVPTTPTPGTPISTQIEVYDALGDTHQITLGWTQVLDAHGAVVPNQWKVQVVSPDDLSKSDRGTADVTFGGTLNGGATAPDGTPSAIAADAADAGSVSGSTNNAGAPATLSFSTSFIAGQSQTISVNLGDYGAANGTTQYAGTDFSVTGLTQDGVPPGKFSSVSLQSNGDVVVNYDNGQANTVAQVPVVTFAAPDALQRQDGQAFTQTVNSGVPLAQQAGQNGAGTLVTGSVESSNVDIATELTNLIVAQRAYAANAKVVTTADQLLQTTLDLKQ